MSSDCRGKGIPVCEWGEQLFRCTVTFRSKVTSLRMCTIHIIHQRAFSVNMMFDKSDSTTKLLFGRLAHGYIGRYTSSNEVHLTSLYWQLKYILNVSTLRQNPKYGRWGTSRYTRCDRSHSISVYQGELEKNVLAFEMYINYFMNMHQDNLTHFTHNYFTVCQFKNKIMSLTCDHQHCGKLRCLKKQFFNEKISLPEIAWKWTLKFLLESPRLFTFLLIFTILCLQAFFFVVVNARVLMHHSMI